MNCANRHDNGRHRQHQLKGGISSSLIVKVPKSYSTLRRECGFVFFNTHLWEQIHGSALCLIMTMFDAHWTNCIIFQILKWFLSVYKSKANCGQNQTIIWCGNVIIHMFHSGFHTWIRVQLKHWPAPLYTLLSPCNPNDYYSHFHTASHHQLKSTELISRCGYTLVQSHLPYFELWFLNVLHRGVITVSTFEKINNAKKATARYNCMEQYGLHYGVLLSQYMIMISLCILTLRHLPL